MDSMKSIGTTFLQMGKNAINNPAEFGSYGFSSTKKAISNSLPRLKLPSERSTPDENFQNGNSWGSRTKDSFTSSKSSHSKAPRQHASNIAPHEHNIHGGRLDITA